MFLQQSHVYCTVSENCKCSYRQMQHQNTTTFTDKASHYSFMSVRISGIIAFFKCRKLSRPIKPMYDDERVKWNERLAAWLKEDQVRYRPSMCLPLAIECFVVVCFIAFVIMVARERNIRSGRKILDYCILGNQTRRIVNNAALPDAV